MLIMIGNLIMIKNINMISIIIITIKNDIIINIIVKNIIKNHIMEIKINTNKKKINNNNNTIKNNIIINIIVKTIIKNHIMEIKITTIIIIMAIKTSPLILNCGLVLIII